MLSIYPPPKPTTITGPSIQPTTHIMFDLMDRLGSGDPLTCDETGFTIDSTRLTIDRTEA